MTWTPERDAELLRLRREKVYSREIAKRLGLRGYPDGGRNAVLGRAWRLNNPTQPTKRKSRKPYTPDPNCVLAAAIVADGGTYAEAMEETGLDWDGVYRAVMASKERDRKDRQRLEADHAP